MGIFSNSAIIAKPQDSQNTRPANKAITSNEKKIYSYLNNLLADPVTANLNNLLKNNKCNDYLFNYPLEEGDRLLTRLVFNPTSRKALSLCNPDFMKSLSQSQDLAAMVADSPLTCLLANDADGQLIFKILLVHNPELAQSVTTDDLCLKGSEGGNILYGLAGTICGKEILKILFSNNTNLARSISSRDLCLVFSSKPEHQYANTSALYWLSVDPAGQEIIKILFAHNQKLVKSIRAEELCLARTSGKDVNVSPLYLLSLSIYGQRILKTLFQNNSKLVKSISTKALCLEHTSATNEPNQSPLNRLLKTAEGREVLEILRCNNPAVANLLENNNSQLSLPSQMGMFANSAIQAKASDEKPVITSGADLAETQHKFG